MIPTPRPPDGPLEASPRDVVLDIQSVRPAPPAPRKPRASRPTASAPAPRRAEIPRAVPPAARETHPEVSVAPPAFPALMASSAYAPPQRASLRSNIAASAPHCTLAIF